ncbi:MAG: hypothetical protein MRY83_07045 [Flavobacteriales bacterium]|nr:hypothetical protein [Flavobacteriales bacterium]
MKKRISLIATLVITISHSLWFNSANAQVDLSSNGIPVKVDAPAGATISKGMLNGEFDGVKTYNYEVKKGQFILDVSMSDEDMWQDAEGYMNDAMDIADDEDGFELVSKESNGFIYKYSIDGDPDYNFYYLKIKNNRAIEFEAGLNMMAEFSLDDVKKMYSSAKGAL